MKTRRPARQTGITLIEVCVTCTIMAGLLGAAIPSFQQTLARRSLEGTANQVATDVLHVRSEAVARNEAVIISFGSDSAGSCYVVHTGGRNDCTCSSGPAVCRDGAREVRTAYFATGSGVRVQSSSPSMLFEPVHGTTVPAGTVHVVAANGSEIQQRISIMGRPQACSPGGLVSGYKACPRAR